MSSMRPPSPPKHLRSASAKLWRSVVGEYILEEHHHRILQLACEALDRCQQARSVIDKKGLTYNDRFGQPRARPETGIERDNRLACIRALRELGLSVEEPGDSRPPRMRGNSSLRRQ